MKFNYRKNFLKFTLYVFALIGVAGMIQFGFSAVSETVAAQTDPFLSQRISQIEQRFNNLESRLNRLESEIRISAISPRVTENNDTDIRLLRSQIETLQIRLTQIECGLFRLDERTLTESARRARKKQAVTDNSERCRLYPNTPLQIP